MGLVLTAGGLMQGLPMDVRHGMDRLDPAVRPVLVARTLAGSPWTWHDALVVKLDHDVAADACSKQIGAGPQAWTHPRRGAADDDHCDLSRWWPASAPSLRCFTQGLLPLFEPSALTNEVTSVVRTDLVSSNGCMPKPPTIRRCNSTVAEFYLREGAGTAIRNMSPGHGRDAALGRSARRRYAYDTPHLFRHQAHRP